MTRKGACRVSRRVCVEAAPRRNSSVGEKMRMRECVRGRRVQGPGGHVGSKTSRSETVPGALTGLLNLAPRDAI